jgi:hypothetical protein
LAEKAKEGLIATACEEGDVAALVDLSTSTHGLVSDSLRRIAWPILLGCASATAQNPSWRDLPAHREEGQVDLDVNRAFVYYPKYGKEQSTDKHTEHDADYFQTQKRNSTAENASSPT